jgi:hypothetical protein
MNMPRKIFPQKVQLPERLKERFIRDKDRIVKKWGQELYDRLIAGECNLAEIRRVQIR